MIEEENALLQPKVNPGEDIYPQASPVVVPFNNEQGADYGQVQVNESQPAIPQPEVAPAAQPEVDKTAELVKSLYSNAPPTPKLDQDRLDRIQKMGRLNTLGRGVGVLGNIFSSAMGANVRKAAPDTVTPRLLAEFQNTLDKHKYDKDVYDRMEYGDKKEEGRFAIAFQQRKDDMELRNKQVEYKNKLDNAKTDEDRIKWGLQYEQNERKIKAQDQRSRERNAISAGKAKSKGEKEDKPFKPIEVFDDNGQKILRSQADWSKDFQAAQNDKGFAGNFKALMDQYRSMPDAGRMQIAIDYYNFQQQKRLAEREAAYKGIPNPAQPTYIFPQAGTPVPKAAGQPAPAKEEIDKNAATPVKKTPSLFQ